MTVFFFSLLLLNAAKLQSFGNPIAQFWDFITSHILWYTIIYTIMNVHVWFTASRLDPGLEISSSEQYWAQLDPEGPDTLRPTPGYSPIRLDKPTCVSWCNCAPTHTTHNNYHSTETKRSNTNSLVKSDVTCHRFRVQTVYHSGSQSVVRVPLVVRELPLVVRRGISELYIN